MPVGAYATMCGVPEELMRETARRIGAASSVAAFEDLGIQMNRHSSLCSYLEKLLWLLTGNFAKPGAQYSPTSLVAIARGVGRGRRRGRAAVRWSERGSSADWCPAT